MRRPSRLLLALLFVVAAGVPPSNAGSDTLWPDVLETSFRLRVVAAAIDTAKVVGPIPGPTTGLVPIASVLDRTSVVAKLIHGGLRDAWGRPILYWSDGSGYIVVSLGADGLPQFDYGLDPPYAGVPRGWAGTDPADDLLIVDGIAYRGPASQTELVRRAIADIRSVGTACESFSIDYNIYPGPVTPMDALSTIESELESTYILVLPILDPWGQPYRFWSNAQSYAVVSYGVDGQPDYPYATWGQAEFEALASGASALVGPDVVFVNGQFVQWPGIGIAL